MLPSSPIEASKCFVELSRCLSFRLMEKMSEENIEEVKILEAQIEHLQAEVKALQRQQQDHHKDITFHFRGQMQDAM